MITISKPYITETEGRTRISADMNVDGERRTVWFEVDVRFGKYLCPERCDGFVFGILNYAMTGGHDITCEGPVGEFFYYNLTEHFIESLCRNSSGLHRTRIIADLDSTTLETAGAVGTGGSCGIDSFHAICANSDPRLPRHKITHLMFNNVGNHHGEKEAARRLFMDRRARARMFAEEYGFEYVEGDSNIIEQFPQVHYFVHVYSNMFAVLCLQKLYGVYYYASASPYSEFSLKDSELHSPDHYELLTVYCLSTDTLKVYSDGGSISRFDKAGMIAAYHPSYKYLNVCILTSDNCGVCHKCRRTIMDLYAQGVLDRYREVFDVDYFYKNKAWYLSKAYAYYLKKDRFAIDSYRVLRKEIPLPIKIKAIPTYIAMHVKGMKDGYLKKRLNKILDRVR